MKHILFIKVDTMIALLMVVLENCISKAENRPHVYLLF